MGKSFDKPLVVLTNGNSASASEIFAGAIQIMRWNLVGTKHLGKVLFNQYSFSDKSAIKVTVSSILP